jgi:hypothetical protein
MNIPLATEGNGRYLHQTPIRFMHRCRPDPDREKVGVSFLTAPQDKPSADTGDAIVCRQCLHEITSNKERKIVNGAHSHTFANPEGIVFEIICFRDAWGCGYVGPASPEFTWFAGYVWRIAVCANCHVHLGWRFSTSGGHSFHGLIFSRLTVKDA